MSEASSLEADRRKAHFLVVRLGALGDVVNTMPAVAALRRACPTSRITWIVEPPADALVTCLREVDAVIPFPRKRWQAQLTRPWRWGGVPSRALRFFRDLRQGKPDVALDFQGNLRSALVAGLSGAPRRVGFPRDQSREFSHLVVTDEAAVPKGILHRVEKHLALVRHLFPEARYERPHLVIPQSDEEAAAEFLAKHRGPGPVVVIHPGASAFGAFKRWPTDRFGRVAGMLGDQDQATVVLTWGPGEREIAEAARSASGDRAVLAPATTNLSRLAALLRQADVVIGGDTGPLHLAAALGTHVVGVYGPKDPRIYGPYGTGHAVVRHSVPCSPCTKRRCSHLRCMTAIEPADVFEAARTVLAG